MRLPKLTVEQIDEEARSIKDWSVEGGIVAREFKFADFVQAMAFVNRLAANAEAMNHHPDIDIRYNRVTLRLTTHDSGGLTINDFRLAREADVLFRAP